MNLLGLAYLARRITRGQTSVRRWMCVALFCTAWPLVYQFSLGQPIVLLACVVSQCYDALRAEQEIRAGFWLALLIFRPQYGILLGAVLLWKRRWKTVAAALVGILVILLASAAVSNVPTVLEYPHAIQDEGGFRGTAGNPVDFMINWRSLIVLAPSLGDMAGLSVTLLLGGLTVLGAACAWRGPWQPGDASFPARMTVLLLATLIANYHSHVYGATLLVVPLIDALEGGYFNTAARALVVCAVVMPSFVAALSNPVRANHLLTLLLIGLLVVLLAGLRRVRLA